MQRLLRLDAFEAGRDQIGRLLRRHHPHIDFAAEDRRVELHVRAAFVGHGAQFRINDFGDRRHLRVERIELIAAGHDNLVGRDDGGLAHAAGQLFLTTKGFQVTETVRSGDLADDLGVGHVVIIEDVVGLWLVDFETGQTFVHVQDEIIGVIFTAGPFVQAEIALLLDRFGRRAIEDRFAFLRRTFAGVMAGQILFHLRIKPP